MSFSKKWIGVLAGATIVGAFALVLTVAIPQFAAAQSGPGGRGQANGLTANAPISGWMGRGGPAVNNDKYLADALGITTEQLQAAQQKAFEAALKQAVDKGLITQAQADAVKQRGNLGRFGFGFGDKFNLYGDTSIDPQALLADALGISVSDLQAAQVKARDAELAQAVTDGRLTQAQADEMKAREALEKYFQDKDVQGQVQKVYEQAVKDAVAAGVITQAQADTFLNNLKAGPGPHGGMMAPGFGGEGFGGKGGHGMRGGHEGFGRGMAPNGSNGSNSTPTTPSSQTPMRFTF